MAQAKNWIFFETINYTDMAKQVVGRSLFHEKERMPHTGKGKSLISRFPIELMESVILSLRFP